MGCHILQRYLKHISVQTKFPGKTWIIFLFFFRIVFVAFVADQVFNGGQSPFKCNSQTPGCENACLNKLITISIMRFWSLTVIIVPIPSILFFLYLAKLIFHAEVKDPREGTENALISTNAEHQPFRQSRLEGHNIPKDSRSLKYSKKYTSLRQSGVYKLEHERPLTSSVVNDNGKSMEESARFGIGDNRMLYMEKDRYISPEIYNIGTRKFKRKRLRNHAIFRAYLFHVFSRTLLEVGFIIVQHCLYGFAITELYQCSTSPCSGTTQCFVPGTREKTYFLWLMYAFGGIACVLSFTECCTLLLENIKITSSCCNDKKTHNIERRRSSVLKSSHRHKNMLYEPGVIPVQRFSNGISESSLYSDTTVESV